MKRGAGRRNGRDGGKFKAIRDRRLKTLLPATAQKMDWPTGARFLGKGNQEKFGANGSKRPTNMRGPSKKRVFFVFRGELGHDHYAGKGRQRAVVSGPFCVLPIGGGVAFTKVAGKGQTAKERGGDWGGVIE